MQRTGNNHDASSLVSSVLASVLDQVLAAAIHHVALATHSGPALLLSCYGGLWLWYIQLMNWTCKLMM